MPTAEMINRLALFFGVTADYLIFSDKERPGMLKNADKKFAKKLESVLSIAPEDREDIERTIEIRKFVRIALLLRYGMWLLIKRLETGENPDKPR